MGAHLQAPYPRATEDVSSAGPSTAHTSSSSEEEDDEDEAAEAAEANGGDTVSDELGTQASGRLLQRSQTVYLDPAPHLATSDSGLLEGGSLPKRQLQRMETMYFDVGRCRTLQSLQQAPQLHLDALTCLEMVSITAILLTFAGPCKNGTRRFSGKALHTRRAIQAGCFPWACCGGRTALPC